MVGLAVTAALGLAMVGGPVSQSEKMEQVRAAI